ncbi:GNAT family N-acetyltransferase [Schaalia sp. lx-100]|uniref:GNAT family N-acetyltransferase n=1 Tax=Schaalia sp. lx-100 TaxID=2899081 RepID=UPI001E5156C0|nr:GNAT family N-acetyltransferase [Schaalia sp. lx-100]MCD4558238.1 hypothetical protein [Schaalia sp. lx-100]
MPTINLVKTSPIKNTFRVAKIQGMFDIPRADESTFTLRANMPIDEKEWTIGLITGASGSGKTTIARHLWPNTTIQGEHQWNSHSLVDDFPREMTPQDITLILNSVGFSSTPAWLRPYHVLSTGQQFRADLARALAETPNGLVVFDEFTSTVDRTVAAAASHAVAKTIRRQTGRQFVAVTCHKDVEEWLQPDWVFDTDTNEFTWGCKRRPQITMVIREGLRQAWPIFRNHHYLTGDLSPAARVFLAYVKLGNQPERLAGFFSILPSMGHKGWRRGHRTVVLPDFQGLGIGNRMIETVAELLWQREHLRFRAVTSSPALVKHRLRHPDMWRLAQGPSMKAKTGRTSKHQKMRTSAGRLTTGWVFIPQNLRR